MKEAIQLNSIPGHWYNAGHRVLQSHSNWPSGPKHQNPPRPT